MGHAARDCIHVEEEVWGRQEADMPYGNFLRVGTKAGVVERKAESSNRVPAYKYLGEEGEEITVTGIKSQKGVKGDGRNEEHQVGSRSTLKEIMTIREESQADDKQDKVQNDTGEANPMSNKSEENWKVAITKPESNGDGVGLTDDACVMEIDVGETLPKDELLNNNTTKGGMAAKDRITTGGPISCYSVDSSRKGLRSYDNPEGGNAHR